jgi:hypothetical protein
VLEEEEEEEEVDYGDEEEDDDDEVAAAAAAAAAKTKKKKKKKKRREAEQPKRPLSKAEKVEAFAQRRAKAAARVAADAKAKEEADRRAHLELARQIQREAELEEEQHMTAEELEERRVERLRCRNGVMKHSSFDGKNAQYFGDCRSPHDNPEGQFLAHGYGLKVYEGGEMYVGDFVDDKQDGFGTLFAFTTMKHGKESYSIGVTWTGQWHQGKQHGFGLQYTNQGFPSIGTWKNGLPVGKRFGTSFKLVRELKFFERRGNITNKALRRKGKKAKKGSTLYSTKRRKKERKDSGASWFFRFFGGMSFIEHR